MLIRKILIYGSSSLTRDTVEVLKDHYDLVGHIPSHNPVVGGVVDLPVVDLATEVEHDIKLSLQYNRKLHNIENAYNVHTGLLPMWGGTDILYHTIKEGSKEQGLTFHKMSDEYDYGPIVSKIAYPVIPGDTMIDLFDRIHNLFPQFTLASLKLLESLTDEQVNKLPMKRPRLFKRGLIKDEDLAMYEQTLPQLKMKYEY